MREDGHVPEAQHGRVLVHRVEIGYMVVSAHRRRGYAEEAVRATISPDNIASLNLIRKLGFIQVGRQRHDRRGDELIFHHDEPAGKTGPR